ncbi:sensor histidine kinase [Comamonas sp. JC664]|uniref:sensor histidine kinase n=1 Tax=Comamonas sp. JC664 TaxID=2801917 RepID=UPI003607B542
MQLQLPADLPLLWIDAAMMERVLVNLLDNASKYTPVGTAVRVTAQVERDQLLLRVQDSGPGLPAHLAPEQLFAPFSRGHAESSISGIGLGLALASALCKPMVAIWMPLRPSLAGGRVQRGAAGVASAGAGLMGMRRSK